MLNSIPVDPAMDGVDHINIYSKGRTELGRLLTNFAHTPFVHPVYGKFESMEGFYYYLKSGGRPACEINHTLKLERLRELHGFQAKEFGRKFDRVDMPRRQWYQILFTGLVEKVRQNQNVLEMLRESELPFVHYYLYGAKVFAPPGHAWLTDGYTCIRENIRSGVFFDVG